jgi:carbamoyl-phosphate synthase/aspartate carbamoyltransferase
LQRTVAAPSSTALTNGKVDTQALADGEVEDWKSSFDQFEWVDPNTKNLVAEGNISCHVQKDLL